MAQCGVASRRKCEEIILEGRVQVNGETVRDMGIQVDPERDVVLLDGKPLRMENAKVYILLNKPRGYITSVGDPFGRPTVLDLIGKRDQRVYPIGRLDYDTEGLLLLTNDGEMAFKLTHPRHEVEKEYYCVVKGCPGSEALDKLRKGLDIGGYITAPAKLIELGKRGDQAAFRIIIHEGKNRQVRRMFDAIGHPVLFLRRERMGPIKLGKLKPGEWRYLSDREIGELRKILSI